MVTLRARFDGNVLIPTEPTTLRPGQEVDLQVVGSAPFSVAVPTTAVPEDLPLGSAARILLRLQQPRRASAEAVREWEQAIESGKTPASDRGAFDDLA